MFESFPKDHPEYGKRTPQKHGLLKLQSADPVTESWPLYPSLHCYKCGTPARHHPDNRNIMGCQKCGCYVSKHDLRPDPHQTGTHFCRGCGNIHDLLPNRF